LDAAARITKRKIMGNFKRDITYHTKGFCIICSKKSSVFIEYLHHKEQFVVCSEHSYPETHEEMIKLLKENQEIYV
jgi:hypothetical protein